MLFVYPLTDFHSNKVRARADVFLPWPNPSHVPFNIMLMTPRWRDKETEGQTSKITCPKSSNLEVVELNTEPS